MMNKYAVSLIRPMTVTVEVEASTETEARAKALNCVSAPERAFPWETHSTQITGTQLIPHADRDAAKLEVMLNVLRNNGFEVEELTGDSRFYNAPEEIIGYDVVGRTPESEISTHHEIKCASYAERLTPDNFFAEWKKAVASFDPAAATLDVLEGLSSADAASCLRDTLEDFDAYAYQLRAVASKMQKAMLAFDQKGDS